MKKIIIAITTISLIYTTGQSQVKVDFGDIKDGMVMPRGKVGATQNDTVGTILFDTSSFHLFIDNGVEYTRIPYANSVHELNSADGKTNVSTTNKSLAVEVDGSSIFKVDSTGRISFSPFINNTYVGFQSGQNNVNGAFNSFYGYNSGFGHRKGESNTFLGYSAGYFADSTRCNTYIGASTGAQGDFKHICGM